jgi:predicted nucleic acid-binding protein
VPPLRQAPSRFSTTDPRASARLRLGFEPGGTLGVVLDAKRVGLVTAVAPLIDEIRSRGLFLSNAVVENALKIAGEAK